MAPCSRESSLHAVVRAGFPIGTNSNPGGGWRSSVNYPLSATRYVGVIRQAVSRGVPVTLNSSFFFLSLFSMSSNQDLCFDPPCGFCGMATSPGGSGAVQSMMLPFLSLLCLSLAWLPAGGPPFFSLPMLNGAIT